MSYDLHISRAGFWAENEGHEISADEWLALVASDPTLTINVRNGPYFAELESPSQDAPRWLDWDEGNIVARNPDRETVQKMLQVAGILGASVQGDDGELYEKIDSYSDPMISRSSDECQSHRTPRYLGRETMWNWIMYALMILAIVAVNLLDLW